MKKQVANTIPSKSPAELIAAAVSKGTDLEKLEMLLSLQERWEKNEARKVFASSFALVQRDITLVAKTAVNEQTRSKNAKLEDIIESVKPIYTKEGFSVIFYEEDTIIPDHIRICVDILHRSGHKEKYHYNMPLDGVGIRGNANMTKIHGKASSISYGRRYLMCMVWNIPTGDDDDGVAASKIEQPVTEEEIQTVRDWIISSKSVEGKLLKHLGITKLEDMTKKDYNKAIVALKTRKEQNDKKEKNASS
jgi:hypothetical protein